MTSALGAGRWPSLRGCASADTARAVVLQTLEDEVEAELELGAEIVAGLQDVLAAPFSPRSRARSSTTCATRSRHLRRRRADRTDRRDFDGSTTDGHCRCGGHHDDRPRCAGAIVMVRAGRGHIARRGLRSARRRRWRAGRDAARRRYAAASRSRSCMIASTIIWWCDIRSSMCSSEDGAPRWRFQWRLATNFCQRV